MKTTLPGGDLDSYSLPVQNEALDRILKDIDALQNTDCKALQPHGKAFEDEEGERWDLCDRTP